MKVKWMLGRGYYCPKWGRHHWTQSSGVERCIPPHDDTFTVENICECGAIKRIYSKNIATILKHTNQE